MLDAAPAQAVLAPSESMPEDAETVCGWDFERGRDLDGLLDSLLRTGFQATHFGRAVNEVNRMVPSPTSALHACIMHEEIAWKASTVQAAMHAVVNLEGTDQDTRRCCRGKPNYVCWW